MIMKQCTYAVDLALKYNETELAAEVTETPSINDALRKNLCSKIAKKIIQQNKDIKPALAFLQTRAQLLRIEDLLPLFEDFVFLDDCKEDVCATLENYARQADDLKKEVDQSAKTVQHIRDETKALGQ